MIRIPLKAVIQSNHDILTDVSETVLITNFLITHKIGVKIMQKSDAKNDVINQPKSVVELEIIKRTKERNKTTSYQKFFKGIRAKAVVWEVINNECFFNDGKCYLTLSEIASKVFRIGPRQCQRYIRDLIECGMIREEIKVFKINGNFFKQRILMTGEENGLFESQVSSEIDGCTRSETPENDSGDPEGLL